MSVFEIGLGFAIVGAALLVTWAYTRTRRGQTFGRDIMDTKKRIGIWISPSLIARHWPAFVLIVASIFGVAALASLL